MKTADSLPYTVTEQPDVGIVMPDGCRLSARVWMPSNALDHPVPGILEYLPYRKRDGTVLRDALTHPWLAGHGYACLRVDMRGNGDSHGLMHDEYTVHELDDALAVIEWACSQPWCDGNVGMMGISWGGFNSLQMAARRPAALKAIITLCSSVDRFADDIHYKGGCLLNENVGWAANMLSYSSRPPDPLLRQQDWRELWLHRLEQIPFLASTWLRHQHRDAYWKHGSVCEEYASIDAAVLTLGGWHDGYRNTPAHLVDNLGEPVKGIVGPWIHKYPHYAAPQPAIGFLQEARRWWDRWLKGIDTGVENDPAYRVWLMDSIKPERWLPERPGRWLGLDAVPRADDAAMTLYAVRASESAKPTISAEQGFIPNLSAERDAIAESDDAFPLGWTGLLTDQPGNANVVIQSPQHCGETSGEYFPFAFGPELPDNQRADDARSACFDGAPLHASYDIVGAPRVALELSSDQPLAQLVVRLCDLRPDGTSALITWGMLNLAHRDSFEQPSRLSPGVPFRTELLLDQIAYRIPAGHRLRLAFSNTCWPFIWPSPVAGRLMLNTASVQVPQPPGASRTPVQFESPKGAPAWQVDTLREALSTREVTVDEASGEQRICIKNDFGMNRDREHGLISGSCVQEHWHIDPDDPLSAHVRIAWQQQGGREQLEGEQGEDAQDEVEPGKVETGCCEPGRGEQRDAWHWETRATLQMRADATHFHINGSLQVINDGETLFTRR